ncbi:MAG: hypothetical protein H7329_13460 [Opitutaceae bacterium]|nr:hypothetical protein [Cytophagales bacterium]
MIVYYINYRIKRLIEDYLADHVKFWRTADGNEVDFVVETEFEKGIAYEVKFSEREFKESKYKKFKQAYPNYPLNCVGLVRKSKDDALWKF